MTRIPRTTAVLLVVCAAPLLGILAATISSTSHALAASNSTAQEAAPRWEYQTMFAKSPEALVAQANQGGSESRKLVSATHVTNTNRYEWVGFFKRVKP